MAKIKVPLTFYWVLLGVASWLNKNFILFYFPYFVYGIIGWTITILSFLVLRALINKGLKKLGEKIAVKLAEEEIEE